MKRNFLVALILFAACVSQSFADWGDDTLWTKVTDQANGFYQIKFSKNDQIFVGHGSEKNLFYNSETGEELRRMDGNNQVFFINNDENFIKLKQDGSVFEIFDTHTFKVIDVITNPDDRGIHRAYYISKDESRLIASIDGGIRIWDLESKQVIRTKDFPEEEDLIDSQLRKISYNCDNSKVIAAFQKEYKDPDHPNQSIYKWYQVVYDGNSLDSIDVYDKGSVGFLLSNNCEMIALKVDDPEYGLEIYDLNTNELIQRIPVTWISFTGYQFSPDDKYIVTTYSMRIWDIETGEIHYTYSSGSTRSFDISSDGNKIISGIGSNYLFMFKGKFGAVSVGEGVNPEEPIIYPNPTTGAASVEFHQPRHAVTRVNLTDVAGRVIRPLFNAPIEPGLQRIDLNVGGQPKGTYFITVENEHLSLSFKLIII